MTMTSAETIDQIAALGVSRIGLARELSLRETAQFAAATTMPLEVFVHNALCVADVSATKRRGMELTFLRRFAPGWFAGNDLKPAKFG